MFPNGGKASSMLCLRTSKSKTSPVSSPTRSVFDSGGTGEFPVSRSSQCVRGHVLRGKAANGTQSAVLDKPGKKADQVCQTWLG